MDIRQAVVDELARRGWSNYKLAKAVQPHMSNQAVYEFLRGSTEMTSGKLGHVLAALGMTLQVTAEPKGKAPTKGKSPRKAK